MAGVHPLVRPPRAPTSIRPAVEAERPAWTGEAGARGTIPAVTLVGTEAGRETAEVTPVLGTELAEEVTMATGQVEADTVALEMVLRPKDHPIEALLTANTRTMQRARVTPRVRESRL